MNQRARSVVSLFIFSYLNSADSCSHEVAYQDIFRQNDGNVYAAVERQTYDVFKGVSLSALNLSEQQSGLSSLGAIFQQQVYSFFLKSY